MMADKTLFIYYDIDCKLCGFAFGLTPKSKVQKYKLLTLYANFSKKFHESLLHISIVLLTY